VFQDFGTVHPLKRIGWKRQLDRVRLGERGIRPQSTSRALQQTVGEVHTEPPTSRNVREKVSGAAADLEYPITRPRLETCPDAAHPFSLYPAYEHARMIVEAIQVVFGDHLVIPCPDFGTIPECPRCHDYHAIPNRPRAVQNYEKRDGRMKSTSPPLGYAPMPAL